MDPSYKTRKIPRVSRLLLTAVEHFGEEGEVSDELIGRTLNISRGGVLMELEKPLPLLSELTISIAFGNNVIKAGGKIIRLALNEHGKIDTAVQFFDIDEESLRIIENNPK